MKTMSFSVMSFSIFSHGRSGAEWVCVHVYTTIIYIMNTITPSRAPDVICTFGEICEGCLFFHKFCVIRTQVCDGLFVPLNIALCCGGKTCSTIHCQNQSSSIFKIVTRNNALPVHGL